MAIPKRSTLILLASLCPAVALADVPFAGAWTCDGAYGAVNFTEATREMAGRVCRLTHVEPLPFADAWTVTLACLEAPRWKAVDIVLLDGPDLLTIFTEARPDGTPSPLGTDGVRPIVEVSCTRTR